MSISVNRIDLPASRSWWADIVAPNEQHIAGIIEVWKEFIDFHAELDPYYKRSEGCERGMAEFIQRCMHDQDRLVLVAAVEQEVIGYVIAEVVPRPQVFVVPVYGSIIDLAVRAPYKRKGVGEALYDRALDWMRSKGVRRIELKVSTGNQGAEAFWNRQGFKEHLRVLYLEL